MKKAPAPKTALNREGLTPIEEARAKLSLAALELGIDDLEAARLELGRLSRPAADPERAAQVDALLGTLGGQNLKSFVKNSLPLLNYPPELQAAMFGGLDPSKAKVIKNAPEALRGELLSMAMDAEAPATVAQLTARIREAPPMSQGDALEKTVLKKMKRAAREPEKAHAYREWLAACPL